jgi:hypothetical protein
MVEEVTKAQLLRWIIKKEIYIMMIDVGVPPC